MTSISREQCQRAISALIAASTRSRETSTGPKLKKMQLAKSVALDDMGMSIVLPRALWGAAAEEQEQRREADPWEDTLRDIKGELVNNERRVLSHDLLETQIGIARERQTSAHARRIGDCMRILGWKGPKQMRVGDRSGRGYWRA